MGDVLVSENKFDKLNNALYDKQFKNGLASYTQTNCRVTLTDNGYRIYRPPNMNPTNNGNTMWGGLLIQPFSDDNNFLVQGHTYILMFHVSGVSSNNATHHYWSNNAGWSGGSYGLGTSPTNVQYNDLGANFQGEKDIYYKFTVSDAIMKTCTKSYSTFVQGTSYNCYRDFKWGFEYTDTGTLGTDLYITSFRCYDITSPDNVVKFLKPGIVEASNFVETSIASGSSTHIYSSGELMAYDFIEW